MLWQTNFYSNVLKPELTWLGSFLRNSSRDSRLMSQTKLASKRYLTEPMFYR